MNASRRGIALIQALAAVALCGIFAGFAITAAAVRYQLTSDARWRSEGEEIAATALARARVQARRAIDSLDDGDRREVAADAASDGWTWTATAERHGAVIRLSVLAQRHAADGSLFATRHASLIMWRDSADTVRVFGDRPRF